MKERDFVYVLVMAVLFVGAAMTANIMSLRMIAPLGIVMDAGTILYPLTFIVRDQIHQRAGKRLSDLVVLVSALANIAMFGCFLLTAALPFDAVTGPQEEFGRVLLPGILVVAGSVCGQYLAERVDGVIYHRIYREGRGSATRAAILSNAVSIPIDSLTMSTIAFVATIPFESYVATTVSNILIKYAVTLAALTVSVGATNILASLRHRDGLEEPLPGRGLAED